MVPIEVVKNAIQLDHDFAQAQVFAKRYLEFLWDETVEIPQSTGRTLEDCNGSNKK